MIDKHKQNIGEALKNIRLNYSMTSKDVYENIMSRTHLYRIENNNQIPSLDKTLKILNRFSMSVDEFEFIRNGYTLNEVQQVLQDFKSINTTVNLPFIKKIISDINSVLVTEENALLKNIKLVLEGYVILQEQKDLSQARQFFIQVWKNLEKKDTWFYNDIQLISNIFYIFDDDTIHYIFQRLDKYFDLYSEFNDVAKTKCATLFNFCNYLRLNNRFDEVSNYIYDVLELAKKCHHTLVILEAKYCICEVEWLKNNDDLINDKVSSLISAIRLAEFNLVADDLLQDWKNLTGVTLNC